MKRRRNMIVGGSAFALGMVGALIYLREPTEPLTSKALANAKETWRAAGIRSYDLTYRMQKNLYEVQVRDALVTSITVNGQHLAIAEPGAYSVEGLFDVLQMELENLTDSSNPLGVSTGSVMARVRFNKQRGYPERYIRGASGMAGPATIEMVEFHAGKP